MEPLSRRAFLGSFAASTALAQALPSAWEPAAAGKAASLAESARTAPRDLLTPSELSDYRATGTYADAVEFARKLERRSPYARVLTIGRTPRGRDMILVVVSKDRAFTPAAAAKSGKPAVFIQNGIHAGEIAGQDATLMLLRDMVVTKRYASWLDAMHLLVLPVFNVDGHEMRSPYNRINQNGPDEMGWRTTAQRINLNRDYLKADAPEMRAWLGVYTSWWPELLIDNHVTDGADYQYDVTLGVPTGEEIRPAARLWSARLLEYLLTTLAHNGHVAAPYPDPLDYGDFRKGITMGGFPPRFSTGYAAAQNRPSVLVETHSLKRYRTRVWAHYDLMRAALDFVVRERKDLQSAVQEGDRDAAACAGKRVFLAGELVKQPETFRWKGLATRTENSEVTGGTYPVYSGQPEELDVPLFQRWKPSLEPVAPAAYAIPREWTAVVDLLRAHGLRTEALAAERNARVEVYRFRDVRWSERPFESRHRITAMKVDAAREDRALAAGTVIVPLTQHTSRVAMHLLEPEAPDSAVRWGFFDTIFEQKEYAEAYAIEPMAKQMLESDPKLRAEFEERLKNDPAFAASVQAKRQFFHDRSPYRDRQKDVYPVLRVVQFA